MTDGFNNPVVGGDGTLIIDQIKSTNYVAGVSGWQETKDGSAEFNNVTVRGSLNVNGANGSYVNIDDLAGFPAIRINPSALPNPDTLTPGLIQGDSFNSGNAAQAATYLLSPYPTDGGNVANPATIRLFSSSPDRTSASSEIDLAAAKVQLGNGSLSNVQCLGTLNNANGSPYLAGQAGSVNMSFTALGSSTVAVTFPVAFAVGVTPIVTTNINSGTGATAQWHSRAINITNTGFTMFVFVASGTSTWANIPVQWNAATPT